MILFSQIAICQNKSIKIEQLLITNKETKKSIKLLESENALSDFGSIIKVKILDQTIHSEDYAKEYVFDDIVVYVSTQGKISSFETDSKNISVEKKGLFNISPGSRLSDLALTFPSEVKDASLINYGINHEKFLCVKINLSDFSKNINDYVDIDYSLNLLYEPETSTLKKMLIWIRP
jgi:hypothetical protein